MNFGYDWGTLTKASTKQHLKRGQSMLKISWSEVTNEDVHANEARSILKTIWHSKHRWLGHVLRHDNLLHDVIEGKMLGKATRGRKGGSLLLQGEITHS